MLILVIILIVGVLVWMATQKSAQKDVAVALLKAAESELELQRRGRLQEIAVKKQLVDLQRLGSQIDEEYHTLADALNEDDLAGHDSQVIKLLVMIWTYWLSLMGLTYMARRSCVQFVDEDLTNPETIWNTVKERSVQCFELIEYAGRSRPLTGDTREIVESTLSLVNNAIKVLNECSLDEIREALEYGLMKQNQMF